ncbi:MAG: DUF3489 domain-containing protein [Bacteroidetes bacterium]|nr:DUF3489 domain-containing protein [Bacteroidota bacterium]
MRQKLKKLAVITTTPDTPKPVSKKSQIITMLERPEGASIQQLQDATGWQPHSVRGALVHLKNKDQQPVTSTVVDGTRRYQIMKAEA